MRWFRSLKCQGSRGERGVAAIEFAMWMPVVTMMLSGILDLSFFMGQRVSVARAAADGVRRGAAVTVGLSAGTGEAEITQAAEDRANELITNLGMATNGCVASASVAQPGFIRKVTMTVECDYTPLIGMTPTIILTFPDKVSSTFVMATEQQP